MKKAFYVLLVIAVSYTSCKKEEDNTPTYPPASEAVLNSVSQSPSGYSESYSYDGEGRITTIQRASGSRTDITYASDTVTETTFTDSGTIASRKVVFLNSSGLAVNSFTGDTSGNILSYSTYTYDADNFKIGERTTDNLNNEFAQQTWSISDKNVYYYTSTDAATTQNNLTIAYSYSFEKESTTGNQNKGMKYYGNSSVNVMKTLNKQSSVTGNVYYSFQYTYDDSGRVATQTAYNHQNEVVYTNTYTYK